jgi:hypothetical protein
LKAFLRKAFLRLLEQMRNFGISFKFLVAFAKQYRHEKAPVKMGRDQRVMPSRIIGNNL